MSLFHRGVVGLRNPTSSLFSSRIYFISIFSLDIAIYEPNPHDCYSELTVLWKLLDIIDSCADNIYQALLSAYEREPGVEAKQILS